MILSNETYDDTIFTDIDEDSTSIEESAFYRCRFENSSFQYSEFIDCEFQECSFHNCNLSLAGFINSRIIDTEFYGSKLMGINWGNAGPVIVATYINCLMNNCSFSGMNLTKVRFESCSFVESSFTDNKMCKVVMADCDFSECMFHQNDLTGSNFISSRNYFMNSDTNKISKAKFSLPEAVSLLANLGVELID